jgi:5,5'-dehydrodivanillate O-demethylase
MLTKEENERLTRVGPGTPCGELLRRYWHPVAAVSELTEAKPKKRVRILGEDLVLFRLPSPNGGDLRYGLLAEHCSHRGASLYYGTVEEDGLRCAYHGWKYDPAGKCLEQPFEPVDRNTKDEICHRAYPVEKLAGFLFAYMGPPDKKPLLPRWDVLVRGDGTREINLHEPLRCNWLQAQENTPDLAHGYFLHAYQFKVRGMKEGGYRYRAIEKIEFDEFEWGLKQRRMYADLGPGAVTAYPMIFPNIMRLNESSKEVMHWRVPIDDANTQVFWVAFTPSKDGQPVEQPEDPPAKHVRYRGEDGEFLMTTFPSQDAMAWETQGVIFDRTKENLGASDQGIMKFRRMLREQMRIVEQGGDPIALVTDSQKNQIIEFTTLQGTPDEGMRWVELLEKKVI